MTKPKGRHRTARLSAVAVRKLTEPGMYCDGGGLYLRVADTGAKRWVLRTVVHGRRRDIGLGSASLVSLAEARAEAMRLRRIARSGGDPLAERQRKQVPTFETAVRIVHEARRPTWKNAKHAAQWINTLAEYAFPVLGAMPVSAVSPGDVLRVLNPIWTTKPETAHRVRQRMAAVFDWAIAAGFRDGNPVHGITKGLPKVERIPLHQPAMPFAEVPGFLARVRELHTATALALEFLILTASRTGEVLGATWNEIDLEARVWTVPAERMKAKRAHRVPLSVRCIEILDEIGTRDGHIFPGRRGGAMSNMALLMLVRRLGSSATVHGFRSSFRDWSAERTQFSREVCEMALAHTISNKAEAAYRRGDLFEKRRKLMAAWADYCIHGTAQIVKLRA